MKRTLSIVLASSLVWTSVPARASEAPRVIHEPMACIPEHGRQERGNQRVVARATLLGNVTSARVYFREITVPNEHYLEMRRGESGIFWAVLPVPDKDNHQARYRIVIKDDTGQEASTGEMTVPVTKDCVANLNDDEKKYADNLVIGQTVDGQKEIPPGWECIGVVGEIEPDGDLNSVGPCKGFFFIPPVLLVGAAAATVAGGIIIVTNTGGGGRQPPASPSRPAADRGTSGGN